jgi:hypothetical protein
MALSLSATARQNHGPDSLGTRSVGRLQRIQRESEASVREPLLDEIIKLLGKIIPLLSRARVVIRMDLGVIDKPPAWY